MTVGAIGHLLADSGFCRLKHGADKKRIRWHDALANQRVEQVLALSNSLGEFHFVDLVLTSECMPTRDDFPPQPITELFDLAILVSPKIFKILPVGYKPCMSFR